ncbi:MAG TPA: hypothetical protein PKC72_03770 [Chitinophagaceae bacterium]|nr:hypothetical protein [Chitinophagaceae bacterium]
MEEKTSTPDSLQDLHDIRKMMNRSSRFISLSGLSGIAAGVCALAGAAIAVSRFNYYKKNNPGMIRTETVDQLTYELLIIAVVVLIAAFVSSFLFTWRRAKNQQLPLWDYTSKRLLWNLCIPLVAGGLFITGMLYYGEWRFVAPACLVFYGLALINASKYTLTDIRYLGYCEIVLGLINMFFIGYGLIFWAIGFGCLHILYGAIMWWKYERKPEVL